MGKWLKKQIELSLKTWILKTIDKEVDKRNKLHRKYLSQRLFVDILIADYKRRYGEDLLAPQKAGDM